jgi:hypothetical protein
MMPPEYSPMVPHPFSFDVVKHVTELRKMLDDGTVEAGQNDNINSFYGRGACENKALNAFQSAVRGKNHKSVDVLDVHLLLKVLKTTTW